MALGSRVDPISVGVEIGKRVAEMYHQDANSDKIGPSNYDPLPETDAVDDQDQATATDGLDGHDAPKATEARKETALKSDFEGPEDTLEAKVAQVCKPPETPERFRYPFGDTVDIDLMLDEEKSKACATPFGMRGHEC